MYGYFWSVFRMILIFVERNISHPYCIHYCTEINFIFLNNEVSVKICFCTYNVLAHTCFTFENLLHCTEDENNGPTKMMLKNIRLRKQGEMPCHYKIC